MMNTKLSKIKHSLILSVISLTLVGCNNKENKTREQDVPQDVDPSIKVENIEEKDYKKIPSYISSKMNSYSSYKSVTEGETVTTFIIQVTQSINATAIKGGYSYLKNESHGSFVNTIHEAYYHSSNTIYKDSDSGDFSSSSLDEYLNNYGTYPFDSSIEGYLVNEQYVESVTKVSSENSDYIFKVVLNSETSTNNVKIQMKKFGGLDDYPTISLIEMNLLISNDFTLKRIDLHSKYKAKKGVSTNCEQNYTVNFFNYNENIEIPNLDSVKDLLQ